VVAAAVIADGIVNLNRFAVTSLDALIMVAVIVPVLTLVALASPNIGVTKVGLVERTTYPVPVVKVVDNTPPALLVTIPVTFNPAIVAPKKVGEAVVATDWPIETILPPDRVTPVPATIDDCLLLNKLQSDDVK
jgi:hypothetical protein